MRRVFRSKAAAIIAGIVSFTAIPAGIAAAATPALASTTICTAFGQGYCVGASTLGNGDPVKSTASGRQINIVDQHFKSYGDEVFRLHFAAASKLCVGATNTLPHAVKITQRDCSNGNQSLVNWAEVPKSDGSIEFRNTTIDGYLTSFNEQNGQLYLTNCLDCTGYYIKWVF